MTRRRKRIHQAINFLPIERLTKSQAIPDGLSLSIGQTWTGRCKELNGSLCMRR
jgi:hypothetical protein